MYFANLIKVKRRKGREESVAVKVKEYQFSKDPKSISLKQQHGVKASQTLHSPTVTLLPLLISRAPGTAEMGEGSTGTCRWAAR